MSLIACVLSCECAARFGKGAIMQHKHTFIVNNRSYAMQREHADIHRVSALIH
jgi:hypothetical protein